MKSSQKRWLILIILAFIWGSSFILMKKALLDLTAIQVGAIRIIFSALSLFLVGFRNIWAITKVQWYYIVVTALLGTFFPVFLFAYAVQNIDSSIVSILNSLTPLNTLIVGVLYFSMSYLRKQFLGVLVGLVGAAILILKGAELNPNQNYWYALCIVVASIGYAINVNIIKTRLEDLKSITITTANFAVLIIPSVIILLTTGFFKTEVVETSTSALGYLLILSVFGTAMAKTMFNKLVKISSPIFSSSVTYLIPLVAIFWGVLDGELLNLSQVFAGGLILAGVYLTNKGK